MFSNYRRELVCELAYVDGQLTIIDGPNTKVNPSSGFLVPADVTLPVYNELEQDLGPATMVISEDKARVLVTFEYYDLPESKKLGKYKEVANARINTLRKEAEVSGIVVPAVTPNTIITTRDQQTELVDRLKRYQNDPEDAEYPIITNEGIERVGRDDFVLITKAILEHVQNCFTTHRTRSEQIEAATTLAELKAVTEDLGIWPVVEPEPEVAPEQETPEVPEDPEPEPEPVVEPEVPEPEQP